MDSWYTYLLLATDVEADPLFCRLLDEEDDFLYLFLCTALSTASLCGYCITHGATTRLSSELVVAAAFLSLFFGGPLHKRTYVSYQEKWRNTCTREDMLVTFQPPLQLYPLDCHSCRCTNDDLSDDIWGTHGPFSSYCSLPPLHLSSSGLK